MFSDAELAFLRSQGLTPGNVYDGRFQSTEVWKARAKEANLPLVLGSPCAKAGHRLRTRAGHCVQCDTRKLAYLLRHNAPGYVYIAGSPKTGLLKIGTAVDTDQRERNLRNQAYGGLNDWEMLFFVKVENGGEVEGRALRELSEYRLNRSYDKDGTSQEAGEILKTTFRIAINALSEAVGNRILSKPWMSNRHSNYEEN